MDPLEEEVTSSSTVTLQALADDSEKRQVNTLLYCLGQDSEEILEAQGITEEELKKYSTVVEKFDAYFNVRANPIYERAQAEQNSLWTRPQTTASPQTIRADSLTRPEDVETTDIRCERSPDQSIGLACNNSTARLDSVEGYRAKVLATYPDVFTGLGNLGEPYKIELKPDARPHAIYTPRRVPYPLRDKVKKELERMETIGVISRVEKPTP